LQTLESGQDLDLAVFERCGHTLIWSSNTGHASKLLSLIHSFLG
jgi:hypothetical protein